MLEDEGKEEELKSSTTRPCTDPFQQDFKLLDGVSFVLGLKASRTSFCGAFGYVGQLLKPQH
jgi:hypothetical protein